MTTNTLLSVAVISVLATLGGCSPVAGQQPLIEPQTGTSGDHSLTPGPENCKKFPSEWTCSDNAETLIFPEVVAAIDAELKSVSFPPGHKFQYPADRGWYTMPDGSWGRDHFFPIEGTLQVEGQAFCAWIGVWLAERETGSELERTAWEFVSGFPIRRTFTEVYDGETQILVQGYIDEASIGDPSGLADWDSHC